MFLCLLPRKPTRESFAISPVNNYDVTLWKSWHLQSVIAMCFYLRNDQFKLQMQLILKLLSFIFLVVFSAGVSPAAQIKLGQVLPEVSLTEFGKLNLEGEQINYVPWNSRELRGKVFTIYHLAGTRSAASLNDAFIDRLLEEQFDLLPGNPHQTFNIINLDDAMFGTSGIVQRTVEDRKRKYVVPGFALDKEGVIRNAWSLAPDSSAVIILNRSGKVVFFKDRQLSQAEIDQAIQMIKQNL